ncbi:hypothetical protein [Paenibacillus sp. ACRRY]|uniref:hypothetical protein n=1 Tax=Paenibacillus sp. ACRRY TaxID=2918208 RepID=UPI001EF4B68C|nr:hypothetical protein [Paenibacillus sp. ACRRY]MCG7385634.1 hypothetical protein [Paenibacillus sp. ACRRY]
MANTIAMPKNIVPMIESIGMSNGLTSVFIEVLSISGSMLAKTNREREMTIWLAQQDQSVVGIGTVGFDIDEMPWTIDTFEEEKDFMLRMIAYAITEAGWEKLSYKPRKESVKPCLEQLQTMIHAFNRDDVNLDNYLEWSEIDEDDDRPTIPPGYPKCVKHEVYLSCHGCVLCNNGS